MEQILNAFENELKKIAEVGAGHKMDLGAVLRPPAIRPPSMKGQMPKKLTPPKLGAPVAIPAIKPPGGGTMGPVKNQATSIKLPGA